MVSGSFTGVMVISNVSVANVSVPSVTSKSKLSLVTSLPLWVYITRLFTTSSKVKLLMATPGSVVSSTCPLKVLAEILITSSLFVLSGSVMPSIAAVSVSVPPSSRVIPLFVTFGASFCGTMVMVTFSLNNAPTEKLRFLVVAGSSDVF